MKEDWEKIVSNLGISNLDHVIVYDNSDVFSSCRVWYTFLYFGHDPKLISVLDGGFKKWINEKRPTLKRKLDFENQLYVAKENTSLVINKDEVNKNIDNKKFQLIDARGEQRFLGLQPEIRKELKSGNIKGSKNLPFQKTFKKKITLKKKEELIEIFKSKKVSIRKRNGFYMRFWNTACILGLANSIISGKTPVIYDGSWAEYGLELKNMKTSTKIKTFLIIFFIAIFAIIASRHFIGLHFKKKFSVRPAPGVIVYKVEKSLFYKSIETFGTAIAQNSKAYRVQAR